MTGELDGRKDGAVAELVHAGDVRFLVVVGDTTDTVYLAHLFETVGVGRDVQEVAGLANLELVLVLMARVDRTDDGSTDQLQDSVINRVVTRNRRIIESDGQNHIRIGLGIPTTGTRQGNRNDTALNTIFGIQDFVTDQDTKQILLLEHILSVVTVGNVVHRNGTERSVGERLHRIVIDGVKVTFENGQRRRSADDEGVVLVSVVAHIVGANIRDQSAARYPQMRLVFRNLSGGRHGKGGAVQTIEQLLVGRSERTVEERAMLAGVISGGNTVLIYVQVLCGDGSTDRHTRITTAA